MRKRGRLVYVIFADGTTRLVQFATATPTAPPATLNFYQAPGYGVPLLRIELAALDPSVHVRVRPTVCVADAPDAAWYHEPWAQPATDPVPARSLQ